MFKEPNTLHFHRNITRWQQRRRKKMEEKCEDCMKWKEELYWTHFKAIHFSQRLLPDYHNRLVLPKKFSTQYKRKLPQIVTLKSPSGVTYDVGVEEDNEKTLAFGCGWDKFVKDHSLEDNDLLIFKFNRVSEFEVLVFNGETLCEKATSYFVKRCGHAMNNNEHINPNDDAEQTVISIGYGQLPVRSPTSTTRVRKGKYHLSVFKKMRGETSNENLDPKADVEMISAGSKGNALSLAKRAVSPNGFLVVMKPSHVQTKYFLTIPNKWCTEKKLLAHQEVVMQVDQKKWDMKFNYYGALGLGGISTGWKKFVQDNNLCENDVCVFEPSAKSDTKLLHLDVHIFRDADAESRNNG